jgi:hypothetical protein
MNKSFWDKNKVFILGLLGSIAVVLQQFTTGEETNWKVIGMAVFIAVLSKIANEWRGQGLSIVGIIGSLAGVFVTIQQTGQFSWTQFALQAIIAVIATAAPDPKSRGYENTQVIKDAKAQGEQIVHANLTEKPKV